MDTPELQTMEQELAQQEWVLTPTFPAIAEPDLLGEYVGQEPLEAPQPVVRELQTLIA